MLFPLSSAADTPGRPASTARRYAQYFFRVVAALLFMYVGYRAYHVSFTHDEALTYTIIRGSEEWTLTANNHWLNTYLAKAFSAVLGYSELALRLPNVLAFGFYLFMLDRLYRLFARSAGSVLLTLPLLLLNPFVLDFFGLCRGYGLAMAFFTGSLFFAVRYYSRTRAVKDVAWFVGLGVLSIYANYAFFTAVLALHLALLTDYIQRGIPKFWLQALIYLVEGALLVPAALNIVELKEHGELYFGGDTNSLLEDTLHSVVVKSFLVHVLPEQHWLVLGACCLAAVVGFVLRKSPELTFSTVLTLALALLPAVLFALSGTKFPVERSALYWPIVLGIHLLFVAEALLWLNFRLLRFAVLPLLAVLSLLFVVNFAGSANVTFVRTWAYEAHTRDILEQLEQQVDKSKPIQFGVTWFFEPSISYYRDTRNLTWLDPLNRTGPNGRYDYYYVFGNEFHLVPAACKQQIIRYEKNPIIPADETDTECLVLKSCDPKLAQ